MSNMSYCRWQNTYLDLVDCLEALDDNEYPSSDYEKNACRNLFRNFLGWCMDQGIIEEWDDEELAKTLEGGQEIY